MRREIMRGDGVLIRFVDVDYSRWRRHSWCGRLAPEQFENQNLA